jgi:hypothetical protein
MAAAGSLLVIAPVAEANDCTTGAKAAAEMWKEYDKAAKQIGCAGVTAGAAIASGGATLPRSAKVYKKCFETAEKADKTTRKAVKGWNKLNKNGWGTIGPRDMSVDETYDGTIPSQFTRMYVSGPLNEDSLRMGFRKRDEGANKGKTRVTVCKFPPGGPGVGVKGEEIWQFTVPPGKANQGKVWLNGLTGLRGHVLTVALKGQSAVKQMKYSLGVTPLTHDHRVLIASSDVSGSTAYTLNASGSAEPVNGKMDGYTVTNDSQDGGGKGTVGSGNDGWLVNGDVLDVSLDKPGNARVLVDGQPYNGGRVSGKPAAGNGNTQPSGADHVFVIDSSNKSGSTDYKLLASGRLEQIERYGIGGNDSVSGGAASGSVGNGADGFRIYGELKDIEIDDPSAVELTMDGKPYAYIPDNTAAAGGNRGQATTPPPAASAGQGEPDHMLVIDSTGKPGSTDYTVKVSGRIEQVESYGIGGNDSVSGRTASGGVGNGADAFRIYGEIEDIDIADPSAAEMTLDGASYAFIPDTLPDVAGPALPDLGSGQVQTVIIDSTSMPGGTGYSLEAGGRIEQVEGATAGFDLTIGSDDRIDGASAEGRVTTGADGFRVYGGLQGLDLDDPSAANVHVMDAS